jgi:hypothetical protein
VLAGTRRSPVLAKPHNNQHRYFARYAVASKLSISTKIGRIRNYDA